MGGRSFRGRARGLNRAARLSAGLVAGALLATALYGCGGGGGGSSGGGGNPAAAQNGVAPPANLTVADVNQVVTQAGNKATSLGRAATIAVVDRVGNVLAVVNVGGGAASPVISSALSTPPRVVPGPNLAAPAISLESQAVPATLAAIAKAVTGAFLSSNGNAFSTRTASQIVQEHFNPLVDGNPGGPLFGVQFSQLPCSDLSTNATFVAGGQQSGVFAGGTPGPGPHRSPLGLSADPGGFPLYKNGTLVGGIGVIADGGYSLDRDVTDFDDNLDERLALAGTSGFDAPDGIRASQITVGGVSLRYSDLTLGDVGPVSSAGPLPGVAVAVPGYFAGTILPGTAFTQAASGVVPDTFGDFPGLEAYVLVKNDGTRRFPPTDSVNPMPASGGMSAAEVRTLLSSALRVAFRSRAQIRRPLNTFMQVTVSVVDLNGNVLGVARTPDAPVFGTDVSLQKGRTAMFFSRATLAPADTAAPLAGYYTAAAAFIPLATFPDGHAFSARAIGNLARPFYPDGQQTHGNGPLSLPYGNWSPFADGYQLDVVGGDIVAALGGADQASPFCGAGVGLAASGGPIAGRADQTRLANGAQIFSGGVPVYRGSTLIGGIGVSGDGIFQDDMVAFLGTENSGVVNNAPLAIRSDTLNPQGDGQLRYVNCPASPFLDSTDQAPCP
jgi:uncharacterized protein GlcG (DUF336 family)